MYNPNTRQYEQGWRPQQDGEQDGFIHHGGAGLWQDIENPKTGERSLKEHKLRTVWESCPKGECYFEITNSPRREATCNKCGFIAHFIVGIDELKDGKFYKRMLT